MEKHCSSYRIILRFQWILQGLALCWYTSGCSTTPLQLSDDLLTPPAFTSSETVTSDRSVIRDILELIKEERFKEASLKTNRYLAKSPEDARFHFLNAIIYYRQFLQGDRKAADDAETGFMLAKQFDPSLIPARYYLGMLYFDLKRFDQARRELLTVVTAQPNDPTAVAALCHAAYYAKDIPLAVWAVDKWLLLLPDNRDALKSAAMIYAVAGDYTRSQFFLIKLEDTGEQESIRFLKRRLQTWRQVYQEGSPVQSASAGKVSVTPDSTGVLSSPRSSLAPSQPAKKSGKVVARLWSDCQQTQNSTTQAASTTDSSNDSDSSGSSGSSGNSGPVQILPALPSPCEGIPLPRMAVFDVVMIRTDEDNSYGSGLNLLDGLKMTLGYSWSKTRQIETAGDTFSQIITSTAGLPSAGVTYSLNIFNTISNRTDVIARPSLIALDRVGSTFFSGYTVSVSIAGVNDSTLQDKNIGILLSLTPTFLNDETMLLAINVGRSTIEPIQIDNFNESLTTSQNTISANVMIKFGETVILSGLRSQEYSNTQNGVPVLDSIPLVQYLFNRSDKEEISKHIIVLVTPRKPASFDELVRKGGDYSFELSRITDRGQRPKSLTNELELLTSQYQENLAMIISNLGVNNYYLEFRAGDLSPRRFPPSHSLRRLWSDLRELLYY